MHVYMSSIHETADAYPIYKVYSKVTYAVRFVSRVSPVIFDTFRKYVYRMDKNFV